MPFVIKAADNLRQTGIIPLIAGVIIRMNGISVTFRQVVIHYARRTCGEEGLMIMNPSYHYSYS